MRKKRARKRVHVGEEQAQRPETVVDGLRTCKWPSWMQNQRKKVAGDETSEAGGGQFCSVSGPQSSPKILFQGYRRPLKSPKQRSNPRSLPF